MKPAKPFEGMVWVGPPAEAGEDMPRTPHKPDQPCLWCQRVVSGHDSGMMKGVAVAFCDEAPLL